MREVAQGATMLRTCKKHALGGKDTGKAQSCLLVLLLTSSAHVSETTESESEG